MIVCVQEVYRPMAPYTDTRVRRVTTPAGDPAWLVSSYHDVKQLLTDSRLGRSHPDPERAPRYTNAAIFGGPIGSPETEQAEHAQMRALLTRSFSAKRMELLRPRIQDLVDGLIDDLLRQVPPADFHASVSFPLPVLVICQLLGVPFADHVRFRHWSDDAADMTDADRSRAGLAQLFGYMLELLAQKRQQPAEDVLSDLLAAQAVYPALTDDGIAQLSAGLLFAGHETTVAAIDRGVVLLATNTDQRAALHADASLIESAVEEILRFPDPVERTDVAAPGGLPRYAHADIQLNGVTIKTGELVLLALHAANVDGAAFERPAEFDIRRTDNPHLTFGHGSRYCIGAPLARIELQSVLATLVRRVPSLRLAVRVDALRSRSHLLTGGLTELPVTW
jgi:cytochrome P450